MLVVKKAILAAILCLPFVVGYSQPQRTELNLIHYDYTKSFRFGFTLGMNVLDFSTVNTLQPVSLNPSMPPVEVRADVVTMSPGFNVNAIVDYRLSPYFNVRTLPGICFGSRELRFYEENSPSSTPLYTMPIESNYVEIPLQLKYSAKRHSNFRPYILGGLNMRANLTYDSDERNGVYFALDQFEPFYEFGLGFDTYFYYFKLSVELKVSKGWQDVLAKRNVVPGYEPYLAVIDKMNSQMFQLSFHFE